MTDAISIALSGINAATTRVQAAAQNISNAQTPNYKPVEAVSKAKTAENGEPQGVITGLAPRTPAFTPTYAPQNPQANTEGFVNTPNVSLTTETVSMTQAITAYKANLAVVSAGSQMSDALLNSFDHRA